ncbi:MAG: aminodeoxychorismate synthase component I [Crocinitomicaceae bacterium]|jgi:para-aminobenzoate synthetase component 1|nr:aminodeoxychorismate synthase component I [Crocinitomicaceae bacterium]
MFQFPISYLNSNDGSGLLAFGEGEKLQCSFPGSIERIKTFTEKNKGKYIFGYIGYDVKNDIEKLKSNNTDYKHFPDVFLWVPSCVVSMNSENLEFLQGEKTSEHFEFLNYFLEEETDENFHPYNLDFKAITKKEDYLKAVQKIKDHIQKGDIYEANYCQEMVAEKVQIKFALDAYFKLNRITKAPFSSFLQFDHYSIFCGSPERYMRKQGNKLISQPIKGTAPRSKDEKEDEELKQALLADKKERSENVMIVDLVRNDLSRIAEKNSVEVSELFGIYSFETVHQMISTVECTLAPETTFADVLTATFPMGSMTGAPKLRAMELIEEYEDFKRGIYSGTIGYITPLGDFDFNVVIRSLFYNGEKETLACAVGSAITIHSDPEKEYQECLTKVQRILDGMNETI